MTSSTLYREGDDLDALLAELSAEYGSRVRVVAVEEDRGAGVRGLFARRRVCVQYRLEDETPAERPSGPAAGPLGDSATDPLAELIARADAAESAPRETELGTAGNAEFAAMLLELAAAKAAERADAGAAAAAPGAPPVTPRPSPSPGPSPSPNPGPSPRPAAAPERTPLPPMPSAPTPTPPTAAPSVPLANHAERNASDEGLVLRRRLADVGVPIHLLPSTAADAVAAVRTIVAALPEAPRPPMGRGVVLAVVGPAAAAVAVAQRICPELQIPADRVWAVGLPADALPGAVAVRDSWDAATAARLVRDRLDRMAVAVVATDTDRTGDRNRQPARILAALQADAVWAVVDATRKPADTRRRLAELGPVTAAVVVEAAETASPATVLELGVPIALLDGEPASPQRWTAALLDALAQQER